MTRVFSSSFRSVDDHDDDSSTGDPKFFGGGRRFDDTFDDVHDNYVRASNTKNYHCFNDDYKHTTGSDVPAGTTPAGASRSL